MSCKKSPNITIKEVKAMFRFVFEHKNCGFIHSVDAFSLDEAQKGLNKALWVFKFAENV